MWCDKWSEISQYKIISFSFTIVRHCVVKHSSWYTNRDSIRIVHEKKKRVKQKVGLATSYHLSLLILWLEVIIEFCWRVRKGLQCTIIYDNQGIVLWMSNSPIQHGLVNIIFLFWIFCIPGMYLTESTDLTANDRGRGQQRLWENAVLRIICSSGVSGGAFEVHITHGQDLMKCLMRECNIKDYM